MVNNQNSYASAVGQKTVVSQPKTPQIFLFTADQLTKFVANVVIQIAQPQVCYPNLKKDTLDLKSRMCRKFSNAAKSILSVDITGKKLIESIGSLSAPPPPPPPPTIYIHEHKSESILQNHQKTIYHLNPYVVFVTSETKKTPLYLLNGEGQEDLKLGRRIVYHKTIKNS